jgi:hypothetical protein
MNIFKRFWKQVFDGINWEVVYKINPDHVTTKLISEMLYVSEQSAEGILRAAVRQGKAKPCCSHFQSERHKNCYRMLVNKGVKL